MGALNPLVAGPALKLEATKTAELDSRTSERATWSAEARVELLCRFFIEFFGSNQFSCRFCLTSFLSKIEVQRSHYFAALLVIYLNSKIALPTTWLLILMSTR